MKKYFLLLFVALFSFLFVACSDDDDNNTTNGGNGELLPGITVKNIKTFNPEQGDTMTYFSLRENKVIDKSRANTTEWDICFHRTSIYVNQGYRGPGNGGAFVLRGVDFETLAELPKDSTFYEEKSETERAIPIGSGKGWYNYNHSTFEITPIPGVVLAIRTADGKYAKVKILSYYYGYPDSIPTDVYSRIDRTYSFKYVFQPNGTKKFTK
jgi:hypothetical protein